MKGVMVLERYLRWFVTTDLHRNSNWARQFATSTGEAVGLLQTLSQAPATRTSGRVGDWTTITVSNETYRKLREMTGETMPQEMEYKGTAFPISVHEFWRAVKWGATVDGQRWGQAVFNALPGDLAAEIVSNLHVEDPYEIDSFMQASVWVTDHLIVDERNDIVGIRKAAAK